MLQSQLYSHMFMGQFYHKDSFTIYLLPPNILCIGEIYSE